ncbi:7-carboxy-7-deazaguanine synthase [Hydromonas duriensis]|uniref:7-carboxy-7-deazaguanine synthase n=1 Tax=Hydromonas duriensis TaxID=1527608 RepID=A0A4R6YB30_9BURK|nr:7-carboxy-7-deazaguanine synthase [Hydromonas duriensis]TDR32725.1 7-carboxy-7-deazaguanine synthase (Cx14CxxC type) [Hydromonas duriensis]
MYTVKEIFYTLQGEGAQAGRAAVFCRFSGCNLWNGREDDRLISLCTFCDTDFIGTGQDGGKFATAEALASRIGSTWKGEGGVPYVVFTGGEPLLQLDKALIELMHGMGFEVGVESNGTIAAPTGIDWLCVSPKGSAKLVQTSGQELKLVYPQLNAQPELFENLDFKHFYIQPLDDRAGINNTQVCIEYCMAHPQWQLSLQTHKLTGIR